MQGIMECVGFFHDEFWDLDVFQAENEVWIGMGRQDPRREHLERFLFDIYQSVGFKYVLADSCVVLRFDECGARWPSKIFKIRTSFQNYDHLLAAERRDRKDQAEMLGIYASTRKPFPKGLVHPAIRRLQWALGEHGFTTRLDGRWDRKTRFALWRFRRRHHLSTPPYITDKTLEALGV